MSNTPPAPSWSCGLLPPDLLAPVDRGGRDARLTEQGQRTVETVTARRRAEIARIVRRLRPTERWALVEALNAFDEAGGEPQVAEPEAARHPLGWMTDVSLDHRHP